MAVVALLVFKWVVLERLHQVRGIGLPRIVALDAIGCLKGLAMMGRDDLWIFDVVTVNAQRGSIFSKVIRKLALMGVAGLVNNVASIAAAVERRMTASALGDMHSDVMAVQAKVVRLVA